MLKLVVLLLQISWAFTRVLDPDLQPIFDYERNVLHIDEPERLRYEPKDFEPGKVTFYLYTRGNNAGSQIYVGRTDNLDRFNRDVPTKVLIHGYLGSKSSSAVRTIKNAYLSVGEYNVIGVDWSPYNNPYWTSVSMSRSIGHYVGELLNYLVQSKDLSLENVHVIGHSLGAHIAGFTTEKLPQKSVGRVTGLDPAAPGFVGNSPNSMLEASDAQFVDVIHTSIRYFGLKKNIGQVDFYPSGGKGQPGCFYDFIVGLCDHMKAVTYFANSVRNNNRYIGQKCNSLNDALEGSCSGETGVMGETDTTDTPGIYFVDV